MTIIQEYSNEPEAYIDKGYLASRGLHPEVSADALSEIFPAPGAGSGSITLSVPDGEAEEAQRLLRERE